jgi:hypothetical protein
LPTNARLNVSTARDPSCWKKSFLKLWSRKMHFTPLPYLDPGSGSFIIQIAIAALLGLGVAIRASWGRIKKFFGMKSKSEEENTDSEDVQD